MRKMSQFHLFWGTNLKNATIWATVTKLGMWVVLGTSVMHVVCRHQMRILNS